MHCPVCGSAGVYAESIDVDNGIIVVSLSERVAKALNAQLRARDDLERDPRSHSMEELHQLNSTVLDEIDAWRQAQ